MQVDRLVEEILTYLRRELATAFLIGRQATYRFKIAIRDNRVQYLNKQLVCGDVDGTGEWPTEGIGEALGRVERLVRDNLPIKLQTVTHGEMVPVVTVERIPAVTVDGQYCPESGRITVGLEDSVNSWYAAHQQNPQPLVRRR